MSEHTFRWGFKAHGTRFCNTQASLEQSARGGVASPLGQTVGDSSDCLPAAGFPGGTLLVTSMSQ